MYWNEVSCLKILLDITSILKITLAVGYQKIKYPHHSAMLYIVYWMKSSGNWVHFKTVVYYSDVIRKIYLYSNISLIKDRVCIFIIDLDLDLVYLTYVWKHFVCTMYTRAHTENMFRIWVNTIFFRNSKPKFKILNFVFPKI